MYGVRIRYICNHVLAPQPSASRRLCLRMDGTAETQLVRLGCVVTCDVGDPGPRLPWQPVMAGFVVY